MFGGCWIILIRWFVDLSVHLFELFVPLELKLYYQNQKYYYFDKSGSSKLYLKLASYITLAYFKRYCKRFCLLTKKNVVRWMMMLVVYVYVDVLWSIQNHEIIELNFMSVWPICRLSSWRICRQPGIEEKLMHGWLSPQSPWQRGSCRTKYEPLLYAATCVFYSLYIIIWIQTVYNIF